MRSRRELIGTGLAVGAAACLHRIGVSRAAWPADAVRLAAIGTGGRFRHLAKSFPAIPGLPLVAVCDVRADNLAKAASFAVAGAFQTGEFREILDRPDVDAVMIAAPDHWHVPMTVAALDAGKHVYVEKPLTHSLEEGQSVIDAEKRSGKKVQVGMQQRSMPHIQKAREIVRSGRLGSVHKVRLTWNRNTPRGLSREIKFDASQIDWKRFVGPAKPQPFDPYKMMEWRWHWDFGGGIFTDLMVHFLDVVNWFLDLGRPAVVRSIGDHFQTRGLWETPDTVQTIMQFPDKELQVHFEGTFVNARNAAMAEFMGTKATLYLDRGRYEIHPERGQIKAEEWIVGEGPRGADFYKSPDGELLHLQDWVDAIRSNRPTLCPAEAGVAAAVPAHLANLALKSPAS